MNKPKYLHTKYKYWDKQRTNQYKSKHKPTCIEDYEKMPFHQPIRPKTGDCSYRWYNTEVDFYRAGVPYLKTKVGQYWDDVYSDMIKKCKPKYRYILDDFIDWRVLRPVFYEDGIPYHRLYWRRQRVIYQDFFVDEYGILRYFETEEELREHYRMERRRKKLERILEEDFFILEKLHIFA